MLSLRVVINYYAVRDNQDRGLLLTSLVSCLLLDKEMKSLLDKRAILEVELAEDPYLTIIFIILKFKRDLHRLFSM